MAAMLLFFPRQTVSGVVCLSEVDAEGWSVEGYRRWVMAVYKVFYTVLGVWGIGFVTIDILPYSHKPFDDQEP